MKLIPMPRDGDLSICGMLLSDRHLGSVDHDRLVPRRFLCFGAIACMMVAGGQLTRSVLDERRHESSPILWLLRVDDRDAPWHPLLGWGLGDLRGYFANSRRLGCAPIVLALVFVPAPAVNLWIGLVGSVAFIPIILFRIRDEEALMMDAFGAEGEAPSEQPRRLIPFVY